MGMRAQNRISKKDNLIAAEVSSGHALKSKTCSGARSRKFGQRCQISRTSSSFEMPHSAVPRIELEMHAREYGHVTLDCSGLVNVEEPVPAREEQQQGYYLLLTARPARSLHRSLAGHHFCNVL